MKISNRQVSVALSAVSAIIALISLWGWITGNIDIAGFIKTSKPVSPLASILILILNLLLLAINTVHLKKRILLFIDTAAALVIILNAISVFSCYTGIDWQLFFLENLSGLFKSTPGRVSFIGNISQILLAWAIILINSKNHRLADTGVIFCIIAGSINVTVMISYGHGTPLMFGSKLLPMSFPASICYIFLGASIVSTAWDKSNFLKMFIGESVKSRLLRTLLPTTFILIIVNDWIILKIPSTQTINPALMSGLLAFTSASLIAVIVLLIVRKLGRDIDLSFKIRWETEDKLKQSNAALTEMNKMLGEMNESYESMNAKLIKWNDELINLNSRLTASERRFKSLFDSMTEGVVLHEMIYDGSGNPADYRIISANAAFEKLTGMSSAAAEGATASVFYAMSPAPYLEIYSRVADTGEPYTFETHFAPLSKHFRIVAFSPEKGKFATVFEDITDRKRYEALIKQQREELEAANEELVASNEELIYANEEFHALNEELQKSYEIIENSLSEKEALLKELYHRTKNNMQVISAMLELQTSYIKDEGTVEIFREMINRIHAMALVHQKLYQSKNLSRINLKEYLSELTALLIHAYHVTAKRVAVNLDVDDISVSIDIAVPCGLVLNELISNSLKHAFPGERHGVIDVSLRSHEEREIVLKVSDDGVGVYEGFDIDSDSRMGIQSVRAIGEHQLRGKVDFDTNRGFTCSIAFSNDIMSSRI